MLELRTAPVSADGNRLGGYAMKWNAPSLPLVVRGLNGGRPFTERIVPEAVSSSASNNVSLLIGHDRRELLATTKSGRLSIRSDDTGLAFDVDLPDTQRARDVRAMVDAGIYREMSFGFYVKRDSWSGSERTLLDIDLRELSIVSDAAYGSQTTVEARNHMPHLWRLRLRLRSIP